MPSQNMSLNAPVWKTLITLPPQNGRTGTEEHAPQLPSFQETWYLKFNHPTENRALSLEFAILISANGFRKTAEVTAVYFQKSQNQDPLKLAVRQRHELSSFALSDEGGIRIGECEFGQNRTTGSIHSKGQSISWDLTISPRIGSAHFKETHYELIPSTLRNTGLTKNSVLTTHSDLNFTGTCKINDQILSWDRCPGMQGHQSGPKNRRAWVWSHCSSFIDEQGVSTPFVFEGLSARTRWLGGILSPKISSFYFHYQGKSYFFNTVKDLFRLRSSNTLNEWNFQADRNEISFRGVLKAEYKDFAGITLEDTNGSLIYCSNTRVAELLIHVYRRGKLEATLTSTGGAAFEIASHQPNPYVSQIL